MTDLITEIRIGNVSADSSKADEDDPRGQLLMWEGPSSGHDYIIGVDPTFGRAGWSRASRRDSDDQIDNAAIEVFRRGSKREGKPDVQVAEYAAPLDSEDLAEVVNFVGRLYGGRHEEGQALVCVEVYPGTGWLVQRELISKFGYVHLPPWLVEGAGLSQRLTHKYGWISNSSTRRDLWTRGTAHLHRHGVVLHSPWLVEEMVDCTPDNFLSVTARSLGGRHDDRVVAMLIALWYANEWRMGAEPEEPVIQDEPGGDWQSSAISAADMEARWAERVAELAEES